MIDWPDAVIRLTAASVIGAAIGLDRELRGKPTGVRTMGIVALGWPSWCSLASIQEYRCRCQQSRHPRCNHRHRLSWSRCDPSQSGREKSSRPHNGCGNLADRVHWRGLRLRAWPLVTTSAILAGIVWTIGNAIGPALDLRDHHKRRHEVEGEQGQKPEMRYQFRLLSVRPTA